MTRDELKARTMQFAIRVIAASESLPDTRAGNVISKQLLRSGCSVGANYRSACRAKSKADFVSKISTVEEEADETVYWIEVAVARHMLSQARIQPLLTEAKELTAIFTRTGKTMKERLRKRSER